MSVKHSKRSSFVNAVNRLQGAVQQQAQQGIVGDMMRDAIIQRFEFTLEVAWKYMRFILLEDGILKDEVVSPKKTIQSAFANGLISDGSVWIQMIGYRNILSHVYDETETVILEDKIRNGYLQVFKQLIEKTIDKDSDS